MLIEEAKLDERFFTEDFKIYTLKENGKVIGSVEFIEKERFIENIYIEERCRGKGYLRQIIDFLGKPLTALPLHQHIDKFKHLGFQHHQDIGEDSYYILN